MISFIGRRRREMTTPPWVPLLGVAVLASVAFSALRAQYATLFNIYVILSSASLISIIGFSQMTVLSVGEFSLAVGGIGELSAVFLGYLLVTQHVGLIVGVALTATCGLCCGLVNGLLVTRTQVSGFVVTLATGGAFAGAALAITETSPYTGLPGALNDFGTGRFGLIPYVLLAALFVAFLLGVMYRWRRLGRTMLAVGGNTEAAELSGLSKSSAVVAAHCLSGLLAAVAGVVATGQLHEANPSVGANWLIQSFTVPIIGGTSLIGGSVSVVGVLVASIILSTISDGLILINVNPYWVTLVEGVLIFLAVLLGQLQNLNIFALRAGRLISFGSRGNR